jgi:hypothetical protein
MRDPQKHIAKAASVDEIRASVHVTPRDLQVVDQVLQKLGYVTLRAVANRNNQTARTLESGKPGARRQTPKKPKVSKP